MTGSLAPTSLIAIGPAIAGWGSLEWVGADLRQVCQALNVSSHVFAVREVPDAHEHLSVGIGSPP